MIRRIIKFLKKQKAFRLINGKYAGKDNFEKKRKLLIKAGYAIGEGTKIVGPLYISADLTIGKNVWIGRNFSAEGNGKINIGDNCDIAPNVTISTGSHKIDTRKESERIAGEGFNIDVTIGTGCWICNSSLIIASKIGNKCIIAAGAVVIKDVPDSVLVAGVPAITKKTY